MRADGVDAREQTMQAGDAHIVELRDALAVVLERARGFARSPGDRRSPRRRWPHGPCRPAALRRPRERSRTAGRSREGRGPFRQGRRAAPRSSRVSNILRPASATVSTILPIWPGGLARAEESLVEAHALGPQEVEVEFGLVTRSGAGKRFPGGRPRSPRRHEGRRPGRERRCAPSRPFGLLRQGTPAWLRPSRPPRPGGERGNGRSSGRSASRISISIASMRARAGASIRMPVSTRLERQGAEGSSAISPRPR